MCRLFMCNRGFFNVVTELELSELWEELELHNGGHGNGAATYKEQITEVYKGLLLEPRALARIVYEQLPEYTIFHTRWATSGLMDDFNCHPFSDGTSLTIAHNGVIPLLSGGEVYSDTHMLFKLLSEYGLPLDKLSDFPGVYVGLLNGKPFVYKRDYYSNLKLAVSFDLKSWCWCSDFYALENILKKRMDVYTVDSLHHVGAITPALIDGIKPKTYKFTKNQKNGRYLYGNYIMHSKQCHDYLCDGRCQ